MKLLYKTLSISFLILFLLMGFNSKAQIKEEMQAMATKGNYGIIYVQIGTTAITEITTEFVGLIEINLKSNIDSAFDDNRLKGNGSRAALLKIAMNLVGKGVQFRKKEDYLNASLCYRFALPLVVEKRDAEGCRIISGNIFIVQDRLREYQPNDENKWINKTLRNDAISILKKQEIFLKTSYTNTDAESDKYFLLYLRLLHASGNHQQACKILTEKLKSSTKPTGLLFDGMLETLTQSDASALMIPDANDPVVKEFKDLWKAYSQLREALPKIENTLATRELYSAALIHFEAVRGSIFKSTGMLALTLSVRVTECLNILGRDLAYLQLRDKQYLNAFQTMERTKSGTFTELMGKGHASRRLTPYDYDGARYYKIRPLTSDEIYTQVTTQNNSVLMYAQLLEGYGVWLITSKGKFYFNWITTPETRLDSLIQFATYQPADAGKRTGNIAGRSATLLNEDSASTDLVKMALTSLYKELLPVGIEAAMISDSTEKLIIIPDHKIHFVPFASLINVNGKYLLESKEISYWGSFTFGKILDDSKEIFSTQKKVLNGNDAFTVTIVGDPLYKGKYPCTERGVTVNMKLAALPGTAKEANAIAAMYHTNAMLQEKAVKSIVTQNHVLDILHLATHGYTNKENIFESFVAFTDGPLYAKEMYSNPGQIKTKLIVLSACQTGLGTESYDSPIGLTQAFLVAGANTTVSSLWSVSDEATYMLMVAFYKNMNTGMNISAALRTAQLELLHKQTTAAPFYWSAFKVTGIDTNPSTY